MKKLIWTQRFIKASEKFISKNPELIDTFKSTITRLEQDPFDPTLKTHKLKGKLSGLLSCSINYYFRIVFLLDYSSKPAQIILLNIGSHEQVY